MCLCEDVGKDRISSLPDDIRRHILSLVPIKCSSSTSVLSRNWRYVWRYVQTIHLDDDDLTSRYSDRTTFRSVVNQLLVYGGDNQSVIPNIYLHTQFVVDLFTLNSWIRAAVSRQVRQLDITIPTTPASIPYDMILILSSSPTLEVLKIDGKVDHHGDDYLCFPLLKVLHLREMSPKAMQRLYTACPLLQELVLDGMLIFSDTTTYLISIPTLKSLTLRFRSFNRRGISVRETGTLSFDCRFCISTPAIESLDIVGPNLLYKFLVDMPFLRKATLDLECPSAYVFTTFVELLNAMPNIHALCLSPKTVSLLGFFYDANLPTFHELTHLEVQILDSFEPQLVMNFIKSLPKLHSFVLMKDVVDKQALASLASRNYFPTYVSCSDVSLINIIEIQGFNGPKDEQVIMGYLLEHATASRQFLQEVKEEFMQGLFRC